MTEIYHIKKFCRDVSDSFIELEENIGFENFQKIKFKVQSGKMTIILPENWFSYEK